MTHDELLAQLQEILHKQKQLKVAPGSVTLDTRIDQLGFDSLSILDFIYEVEERFGIETQLADLVSLTHVRDLVDYLYAKLPPG